MQRSEINLRGIIYSRKIYHIHLENYVYYVLYIPRTMLQINTDTNVKYCDLYQLMAPVHTLTHRTDK
jgi:hypothetical protein